MLKLLQSLYAVALVMVIPSEAQADIYTVRREGATIAPEQATDVSMESEDVIMQGYAHGFRVTATFVMRNQSKHRVDSTVAFPIIGSSYANYLDVNREFKVEIRSGSDDHSPFSPVRAQLKMREKLKRNGEDVFFTEPPKDVADFRECVVWNVSWTPKEVKVIRVSFDMGEPMILRGSNDLVWGWQAMYIVRTGALWKGLIHRANITIQFVEANNPNNATRARVTAVQFGDIRQCSYPEHAKWNGDESISWHFEDWKPTDDIWVRSVIWLGLPPERSDQYFIALPVPYGGDQIVYTKDTIDRLVESELALAKEYLPEKFAVFDQRLLQIIVADWLYHEIYARHGDPFFLGKRKGNEPTPAGAYACDQDGNWLSRWGDKFMGRYGYHGG